MTSLAKGSKWRRACKVFLHIPGYTWYAVCTMGWWLCFFFVLRKIKKHQSPQVAKMTEIEPFPILGCCYFFAILLENCLMPTIIITLIFHIWRWLNSRNVINFLLTKFFLWLLDLSQHQSVLEKPKKHWQKFLIPQSTRQWSSQKLQMCIFYHL